MSVLFLDLDNMIALVDAPPTKLGAGMHRAERGVRRYRKRAARKASEHWTGPRNR